MGLLTPDIGLLFWMLLSFGIVFAVLAKFGFPVIVRMVDKRKAYIDQSLENAKQANEQLANIKDESEQILTAAHSEQLQILKEAGVMREKLIEEAKGQARGEAEKLLAKAKAEIAKEREEAIRQIRREVALLSVDIAEKVIRGQLDQKDKQVDVINRLLDEINISKS
jgi:F-type H+-transporting ATPase subunit b